MAILSQSTVPTSANFDNLGEQPANARRDIAIQLNALLANTMPALALAMTSDGVLKASTPSRGTTVTLALSQGVITIAGVPVNVAAQTAQAFGALGTIPTAKWGIIAIDRVAAGTTTFVSGAANYTTGYATEALAIAACPAKTTDKARVGYVTILATTPGWVAGTDALAGGTGGTPATTTNYYAIASPFELTADSANAILLGSRAFTAKRVGNLDGAAITT